MPGTPLHGRARQVPAEGVGSPDARLGRSASVPTTKRSAILATSFYKGAVAQGEVKAEWCNR